MSGGPVFDLYLLRHGNTFGPGDAVVRLGRGEDPPLVESGVAQAHAAAKALARIGVFPTAVYASPLRRALAFARIVAGELSVAAPVVEDGRLTEIDYGAWGGLTDEEIARRFGAAALEGWNRAGIWPAGAGWGEGEDAVAARVASFARSALATHGPGGTAVAVSSAGTLRYALALVPEALEEIRAAGRLKIGTGRFAHLRHADGAWRLAGWNVAPDELS